MPFSKPLFSRQTAATPSDWFGIRVVDDATGRGVPLVELRTVNEIAYVTDSNGWAAIQEPGLMGNEVFFSLRSHGYTFPKDGFGYPGVRIKVTPGGRTQLKIRRNNIAERVCRLTGEGIYADSLLLGEKTPLREPTLAGKVLGQDSTMAAVYRGRMLWFWGDTNRPEYPLGNFHTTGAVATYPRGQATADAGMDYQYFTRPDGFAQEMFQTSKPGPIWIGGLVVMGDKGRETLITHYARMKDLGTCVEHGYAQWDDGRNFFQFLQEIPLTEKWRFLDGHPLRLTEDGVTYWMCGPSFSTIRVSAEGDRYRDTTAYEAFTCLDPGGEVQRGPSGKPLYRWQKDAPPISSQKESELVEQKKLRPEETHFLPRDPSGKSVVIHGGSVTWNPWRKKWLLIGTQRFAKESALGEIFYAEADHPTGPWLRATKILTHNNYTFYNPVHHPFLDAAGGRVIFFEGTYTTTFSGNPNPTPRYEYNQMLYRLDLTDPRLR